LLSLVVLIGVCDATIHTPSAGQLSLWRRTR
jgi:hypothetical protein